MNYLKKKQRILVFTCIAVVVCTALVGNAIHFQWIDSITNFPKGIARFIELYLPPSFTDFNTMLIQLWSTILLSVAGSFVGMVLGLFAAIAISKKTGKNKLLQLIVRFIASLTRNIPEGVWAITLLICFWFGEFLAFIVLSIISFGFLTRVYADAIDETNAACIEALEATGSSYWQIIFCAVIPEVMPSLISWGLYSAENNIRSSTIIGMLTGSGIGYLISNYKHFRQFTSLFTAILLVVIVILIFDQTSNYVRRRIME
ncbi:MAG: PhnE/PtxC family ABC transporter permease [Anaerorhabdus sp.]|uniref:PhnE/PtxC family ABC transporter permease n=1 Tax=Anaerorhabdus sp. TaxID=1872524 RepID=UPI003A87E49A